MLPFQMEEATIATNASPKNLSVFGHQKFNRGGNDFTHFLREILQIPLIPGRMQSIARLSSWTHRAPAV